MSDTNSLHAMMSLDAARSTAHMIALLDYCCENHERKSQEIRDDLAATLARLTQNATAVLDRLAAAFVCAESAPESVSPGKRFNHDETLKFYGPISLHVLRCLRTEIDGAIRRGEAAFGE